MNLYLVDYLREYAQTPLMSQYVEMLKVELDWFLYNYGEHISDKHRRKRKYSLKERIYQLLMRQYALRRKCKSDNPTILSSIGGHDFQVQISRLGYDLVSSLLQPTSYKQIVVGGHNTCKLVKSKERIVRNGTWNDMLSAHFLQCIQDCRDELLRIFIQHRFKGLFLYTDEYFESKLLISIAKELQIPSFDFLHGLPGIYSLEVDNHTDYLMVWGPKMKQNYINAGFDANKIFVVGNKNYDHYVKHDVLRNSLDDVLVIPISSVLWHQHSWETPVLIDRSMIILYLYEVEHVLKRLNVKHARFRPHPSINISWVHNFLDKDFYIPDDQPLNISLQKSTLVIGAGSTVFLEAIMAGVNYIVFNPQEDGLNMLRVESVPPFDGADANVAIAFNEEDLYSMLIERVQTNSAVLDDYMQPLDLSSIKKLIN